MRACRWCARRVDFDNEFCSQGCRDDYLAELEDGDK